MMGLAKLKPILALASVVAVATAGVAAQALRPAPGGDRPAAPPPVMQPAPPPAVAADPSTTRALAREQLAVIDQHQALLEQRARAGMAETGSREVWDRRKLEALRRAGADKAEILAYLTALVASLKEREKIAELWRQNAQATPIDVLDARYRRIEAEIWLNEEKGR